MAKEVVKKKVIYEGFFVKTSYFDDEYEIKRDTKITRPTLEFPTTNPHVTVVYAPETTHEDLYGFKAYVILRGYGNDGQNEGYKVEIIPDKMVMDYSVFYHYEEREAIIKLLSSIETPHITVSISEESKPKYTKDLKFKDLSIGEIEVLEARFGAFVYVEYADGSHENKYVYETYDFEHL